MKKRMLSMLLALALVLSLVPAVLPTVAQAATSVKETPAGVRNHLPSTAKDVVYLSDMNWEVSINNEGKEAIRNGAWSSGGKIVMGLAENNGGTVFTKGLGVMPKGTSATDASHTIFDLADNGYAQDYFYAAAGITNGTAQGGTIANSLVFEVWASYDKSVEDYSQANYTLLERSGDPDKGTNVKSSYVYQFHLDITGVRYLKLVVYAVGNIGYMNANWAGACVYNNPGYYPKSDLMGLNHGSDNSTWVPSGTDRFNTYHFTSIPADAVLLTSSTYKNTSDYKGTSKVVDFKSASGNLGSGNHWLGGVADRLDTTVTPNLKDGIVLKDATKYLRFNCRQPGSSDNQTDGWVTFDISDLNVNRFYTVIGSGNGTAKHTAYNPANGAYGGVKVQVWGAETKDGTYTLLSESEPILLSQTGEFDVDITGVNFLKLRIQAKDYRIISSLDTLFYMPCVFNDTWTAAVSGADSVQQGDSANYAVSVSREFAPIHNYTGPVTWAVEGALDEGTKIENGKLTVAPKETATELKITASVTDGGKTVTTDPVTVAVTPAPVTMTGIEITQLPKTSYITGESLNTEGLTLTVSYSDGHIEQVAEGFEVTGFDPSTAGTQILTVTYEGFTATYAINVERVLDSIEIKTNPNKTEYQYGEPLNVEGLTLQANYNDGWEIIRDGFEVTGYDNLKSGEQTVTVTYEGKTATFTVTVAEPVRMIGMEITQMPKTEYAYGEEFDTTGLKLVANYSDGSSFSMDEEMDDLVFSGWTGEVGKATITITYDQFTTTYEVNVTAVVTGIELSGEYKTAYNYGEEFTAEGLVVSEVYSDGSKVAVEDYEITGWTGEHGEATITVTYGEYTATYTVTVAAVMEKIELKGEYKTEYKYAETLDTTGLIVVVTYSDGTTAEITEGFTVTGHAPETAGEQTITVAYEGLTATYTVTVAEREPVYVQILKDLESVTVKGGEKASVTVDVIGDGLTFVWYYMDNSTHGKFWPATPQCEETYSVEMTKARNGRSVYCVITDQYGNSVQTATATLNIENNVAIVTQPQSVAVKSGEMAEVTVEVTGENLTYAWYYKDAKMADFMYTKTFTGDTYSTEMNAARNGRQLYCVVSDPYGNKVTTETVTISAKNEIAVEQLPDRVYAKNGEMATVTLDVTGENLTYKWYYLDATMSAFMYTKTFTGNTYSVEMNAVRNGRAIYCVVVDECGNEVRTNTVILTAKIDTPVAITAQPVDTAVEAGEKLVVSIEAEGEGLTYRWYYKEGKMADFMYTKTFTGNTYTVGAMTASRSGRQIYCVVTDAFGNSVTSDTVTIAVIK